MPGYIIVPALSFTVNELAQYVSEKDNLIKAKIAAKKYID